MTATRREPDMSTTTDGQAIERTRDALQARLEIAQLTSSMGLLVDARDWPGLEGLFTDPVEVDYTSLNGGEPQTLSRAELIGGWRAVLEHLDATQHLIAGHLIALDGDEATCAANVQGTHVLANHTGGPLWTVAGRYDFGLKRTDRGWRISALTLTVQWATGNQRIMELAASRGSAATPNKS
jgi:ketosteroid isomerase-like protein